MEPTYDDLADTITANFRVMRQMSDEIRILRLSIALIVFALMVRVGIELVNYVKG